MLLSLTSVAVVLLSASANWLSDGVEAQSLYAGNETFTPQGPSTLVLALIGAATIAAYAAVKWRPLRLRDWRGTGRLSDQSDGGRADVDEQRQSRGAA